MLRRIHPGGPDCQAADAPRAPSAPFSPPASDDRTTLCLARRKAVSPRLLPQTFASITAPTTPNLRPNATRTRFRGGAAILTFSESSRRGSRINRDRDDCRDDRLGGYSEHEFKGIVLACLL